MTYQLSEQQAKACVSALKLRAGRKRQSIRNLERRKDAIIEQVGENEYLHRIKLRERDASKAEKVIEELSYFLDIVKVEPQL